MEAVILIGIQATGKSTFYQKKFADTHVRVNLDMLKTRHREEKLVNVCIAMHQKFVVDNTNPTIFDRNRYISKAKPAGFRIIGYYFESKIEDALHRNSKREGRKRIPKNGVVGTHAKLELPSLREGFDEIHYVRMKEDGGFAVEDWKDEV